jgi:hypothetical protein
MKSNPLLIFIVVFIIFLIEIANLIFIPDWCPEFKSVIIQYATLILTGFGLVAFWYEYTKNKNDFLDTSIDVENKITFYKIKTQVFNKSGLRKDVSYALLFISKQCIPPVTAMNQTLNKIQVPIQFKHTNDFEQLKEQIDCPTHTTNTYVIPLPFYYDENVRIGNESPAYTFSFNNTDGVAGANILEDGIYTARFFIYCKGKLHRTTADTLIIGNQQTEENHPDSPNIYSGSSKQKTSKTN